MGAGDDSLVRESGVVQEDRFPRDVTQQQAGRDDHEVRFAERDEALVVEQPGSGLVDFEEGDVIAGAGEGVDFALLIFGDLGDDMGGGAEAVQPEVARRAGHLQRAVSHEAGA